MRIVDYVTALVLGFMVGLTAWITICSPIAVLYFTDVIHTYPIWAWPLWVSACAGGGVTILIVTLELLEERARRGGGLN